MKVKLYIHFLIFINTIFSLEGVFCQPGKNSDHSTDSNLQIPSINLKWSESEVTGISKILSGKIFLYDQASEEKFKTLASQANIIHLATHAVIDDEAPLYSKFLFSHSNKTIEDGLLHTYEIYNTDLNANLAVLSACNTGTGKLVNGEGIMSLARGFMYAGCPNVVVSLWQVDDKSTASIMNNFYKEIKKGADKDAALRNAKLEYLKNADEVKSNPFYWAGFVLIGNSYPVPFNQKSIGFSFYWIFIFIFVILILLFLMRKKIFPKHGTMLFFVPTLVFIILSIFLLSNKTDIYSQNKDGIPHNNNSVQFDDLTKAQKFQEAAKYDSSIIYFEKARSNFEREKNWEGYIECSIQIAENLINKGEYNSASEVLDQAVEIGINELSESHPVMAPLYNMFGKVYRKKGEIDKSFDYFDKALSISLSLPTQDSLEIAASYHGMGVLYYYKGDYDNSLEYHYTSLSIRLGMLGEYHPLVADSYVNIGIVSSQKGDYDTALDFYHKALLIRLETLGEKHPDLANSYLNIGAIYLEKGYYDNALQYYQKAVSILINSIGENHPAIAGSNMNIGLVYDKKGEYDKALEFYHKSLSMIRDTAGEMHPLVAQNYTNIGVIYKKKEAYNKALEYYHNALSSYFKIVGKNHPDVIKTYLNMANVYSLTNDFKSSLEFYQKALDIVHKIFEANHPLTAIIYSNMGIVYSTQDDFEAANKYFGDALSIAKKIYGEKHPFIAEVYQQMAELYSEQNSFEKALTYYQEAIIALAADFDHRNIYINPPLKNISEEIRLLSLLTLKAETLEKLYSQKTKNQKELTFSFLTYDLALQLADKISKGYKRESSKFYLRDKIYETYRQAVKTAYNLYKLTGETEYKNRAFAFTEKSKANVLRQALLDFQAKKFAGIPDSLLELESQLKTDLAFYDAHLFEESKKGVTGDSTKIQFWQDKIFALNRRYESLIQEFEDQYPEYYSLKFQSRIISPRKIQENIIDENSILVEYFLGEGSLFIFTVTKDAFDITTVDIDTSFEQHVKQMHTGLMNRDHFLYTTYASKLYNILVAPIESKVANKNMIIIPDGPLGYIPFETLLTEDVSDSDKNYRRFPYLIKIHQICYNYSSSLMYENMTRENPNVPEIDYMGFAPVVFE